MAHHASGHFTYATRVARSDGNCDYDDCVLLRTLRYDEVNTRNQPVTSHDDDACRAGATLARITQEGRHLYGWTPHGECVLDYYY